MKSMEDLFCVLLQDIYFAERQFGQALPALAEACNVPLLRSAFGLQHTHTHRQIARLETVFELVGRRARVRHCDAIAGLLADAQDIVARTGLGGVRDAGLLAAAHAIGHYQIARYRTLVAMAERLGDLDAARLLRASLEEKRAADSLLSQLAYKSHNSAMQAA
jgi:ferritin-like metal-binding protein YciE